VQVVWNSRKSEVLLDIRLTELAIYLAEDVPVRNSSGSYSPDCLGQGQGVENPSWAPRRVSLAMPSNATELKWIGSRLA
jgi:hypothetical protein